MRDEKEGGNSTEQSAEPQQSPENKAHSKAYILNAFTRAPLWLIGSVFSSEAGRNRADLCQELLHSCRSHLSLLFTRLNRTTLSLFSLSTLDFLLATSITDW